MAGLRPLNDFGSRILASASTGVAKSMAASRRACRSAVNT